MSQPDRIGERLVSGGYISNLQLEDALRYQSNYKDFSTRPKLGEVLISKGFISESQLVEVLSEQLHIERVAAEELKPTAEAVLLVSQGYAEKHVILPYMVENGQLYIVTNEPLNFDVVQELERKTGYQIVTLLSTRSEIREAVRKVYSNLDDYKVVKEAENKAKLAAAVNDASDEYGQLARRVGSDAVVQLVENVIKGAVERGASDIHIEPKETYTEVRIRVNGDLVHYSQLASSAHVNLVARIKILSGLDISDSRKSQDGRFSMAIGSKTISFRVSTLSCVHGEKVVIRVLGDSKADIVPLDKLGFNAFNFQKYVWLISQPSGIILVTGPTGCGKTTTLYSTLCELARPNVNVVTVEDPVEKMIEQVNQTQINDKAGVTFESSLRAILRQDPNIIMVGEIRDKETAQIAAQASITGHLVLSTIHTNNAASTFMRLTDMGVEPYLVASSITGVVAQRLVKKICPHCRKPYTPPERELMYWANGRKMPDAFYKGIGCEHCDYTGVGGLMPVHEILVVDSEIRKLIVENAPSEMIVSAASKKGFVSMYHDVIRLVEEGLTPLSSVGEVINFIQD